MPHLEHNNIISNVQFGFRQKWSADLQLLQTVHDLSLVMNECGPTDCILLDFSKAFDKVSHRLLLLKLGYYEINSQLIKWITSFLTNRTQQVVCDGSISEPVKIASVFLIFINDLPDCLKSTCSLFVDDCLLYRSIVTTCDIDIIQQDLYCLDQWANKWLMKFNAMKCVALTVTNKTHPIYSEYSLYNQKSNMFLKPNTWALLLTQT